MNILRKAVRAFKFESRNLSLEFILLIIFKAIDSPDTVSSNMQPNYMTF